MATYHVLVPIDTDAKRARAQAEAVVALPAAAESVEVTLLHVFDDKESSSELPEAAERAIEFLTEEREVASLDIEHRVGDPAAEILDAARSLDVDALVLGGRKRSPMGSLVFGSVTTDVVLHADRPVTITGDVLVSERNDEPRPDDHEPARHPPGTDPAEDRPRSSSDSPPETG